MTRTVRGTTGRDDEILSQIELVMVLRRDDLQTTTTATTLSTSRIGRRRRHVLDSANLDAATGERAQRALTARTRRLRLVTTLRAHLDVQRGDAELLASRSDIPVSYTHLTLPTKRIV